MKARVFVTLRPSVFDPQGRTIVEALHSLGYGAVADVRQGKYFELDLDVPSAADAERLSAEVAERVLSNPVIESFRLEVVERGATVQRERATASEPRERSGDRGAPPSERVGGGAGAKPPAR